MVRMLQILIALRFANYGYGEYVMHSDICEGANFSDAEGVTLYVTVGSIANNGDEEDVVYSGDGESVAKKITIMVLQILVSRRVLQITLMKMTGIL